MMRPRSHRVMIALVGMLTVVALAPALSSADETTIGYGKRRPNWDANEPGLTLSAISQPDFGQLWSRTLPRPPGQDATSFPNQIYAQPLVVDGHVIVATEENQVDALDPNTGAVQWSVSLGPAWAPTVSCGDLLPRIGITSTPVYDPATKTIYLVAKTDDGPDPDHPHLRMHALNVADGSERAGWPVNLAGSATNSGEVLRPQTANQRPGLLLMGGAVYFATASHCDRGPYVGFVGRVSVTGTPHRTLWSSESGGSTLEAGIWQSGGGLVSDGPGRIFLATGNGVSPPPGPGNKPPGTLAESVVRLAVAANGTMRAKDFFSPANNHQLDQNDADLGSGGPVSLPDGWGTVAHPHLITITGKDGIVRLLDRDDLGGMAQGPGGTDAVVSSLTLKGVWGRPALFDAGTDHYLYLLPSSAPLQALRVAPNANGVPTLSVVGASVDSYGYTSGSPVVTSDGKGQPAAPGAAVWVVTVSGSTGSSAMLRAFPAVPPAGGNWRPVASFPLGTAAKFVQPATDAGKIFVGTRDGRVLAFGRPTSEAITAPQTDFGLIPVGSQSTETVTITAHAPVTIDAVDTGAPFTAGTPSVPLPVALTDGHTISVPVTFSPSTPDTSNSVLTVHTHNPTDASFDYPFALTGTGTQDGVSASPNALDFGIVTTGRARQLGVTIRNTGTTSTSVTTTTPPQDPFSSTSMPTSGFSLAPQASVTVTVQFTPTAEGAADGTFEITTTTGSVTVPLHGVGTLGQPLMSVNPAISFGNVAPGTTRTLPLTVTNVGTATMTINKAAVPGAPFVVRTPLAEGQTLDPRASITVRVRVAPWSGQPVRGSYSITADDGQGEVSVALRANRHPWTGAIRSPYGCIDVYTNQRVDGATVDLWSCNGTEAQQLTFGSRFSLRVGPATSPWCLGAAGGGTRSGTRIKLFMCDGSAGQVFRWNAANRLVNPASGLCIQPLHGLTSRGVQLVLGRCTAADYQNWDAGELVATRGEMSSGLAATHQICLTDPGAVTAPGTPLEIDPCGTTPSQIVMHRNRELRIANQCLTAADTRRVAAAGVRLMPCAGARTQVFGSLRGGRLRNARTGLCLAVKHDRTAPGTRVWLATCARQPGQRWRLPG